METRQKILSSLVSLLSVLSMVMFVFIGCGITTEDGKTNDGVVSNGKAEDGKAEDGDIIEGELVIVDILGNGSSSDIFKDGIIIKGSGFGDIPTVALLDRVSKAVRNVLTVTSANAEEINARFPEDLEEGEYTLRVSSASLSDERDVIILKDEKCLATYDDELLSCGLGTKEIKGECIPKYDYITCGNGTIELNGVCIPKYDYITCGNGTIELNGVCIPEYDYITCGIGTKLVGTECMPDGYLILGDHPVTGKYSLTFEQINNTCFSNDLSFYDNDIEVGLSDVAMFFNIRFPTGHTLGISNSIQAVLSIDNEISSGLSGMQFFNIQSGSAVYYFRDFSGTLSSEDEINGTIKLSGLVLTIGSIFPVSNDASCEATFNVYGNRVADPIRLNPER